MTSTRDLATLSVDAYSDTSQLTSWSVIDEQSNPSDGFFARTYQSGNQVVIAFRGTQDSADYSSDVNFFISGATHAVPAQISDAIQYVNDIELSLEDTTETLALTGHSLGGALAQTAAVLTDVIGIGFDPVPFVQGTLAYENTNSANSQALTEIQESTYAGSEALLGEAASISTLVSSASFSRNAFYYLTPDKLTSADLGPEYTSEIGAIPTSLTQLFGVGAYAVNLHSQGLIALVVAHAADFIEIVNSDPAFLGQFTNPSIFGSGNAWQFHSKLAVQDYNSSSDGAGSIIENILKESKEVSEFKPESVVGSADDLAALNRGLFESVFQHADTRLEAGVETVGPGELAGSSVDDTVVNYLVVDLAGLPHDSPYIKLDAISEFETWLHGIASSHGIKDRLPDLNPGNFDKLVIGRTDQGTDVFGLAGSNDFLVGLKGAITGESGNDVIFSLGGHSVLSGGDGSDTIFASGADGQTLLGGDGDDILTASNDGADFLDAGEGSNTIYAGHGADTIRESGGNDSIISDNTHLVIEGSKHGQTLVAGSGGDTISAGNFDSDYLRGGVGNDDLLVGGADTVTSGGGSDTIDWRNIRGDSSVLLIDHGEKSIISGVYDPSLYKFQGGSISYNKAAFSSILIETTSSEKYSLRIDSLSKEGLIPAGYSEYITERAHDSGSPGWHNVYDTQSYPEEDYYKVHLTLLGSSGEQIDLGDTIITAEGGTLPNRSLINPGIQIVDGNGNFLYFSNGDGSWTPEVVGAPAVILPTVDNRDDPQMPPSDGPDPSRGPGMGTGPSLNTGPSSEPTNAMSFLSAGSHNDTLEGGAGSDTLAAGGGSDTYIYGLGGGHDSIIDAPSVADTDILRLSPGINQAEVTVDSLESQDIRLTFKDGGSIVLVNEQANDGSGVEVIEFSDGTTWSTNDLLSRVALSADLPGNLPTTITVGFDTFYGGAGSDLLTGSLNSEIILGLDGSDTITAGEAALGSSQELFGNQGNDVVFSSSLGNVSIFGGQSDDLLSVSGNSGAHLVFGNLGNDTIHAFGCGASLYGGQGDDYIDSSQAMGGSVISGDLGNDILIGSLFSDTLQGGAGDDTLKGGGGGDRYIYNLMDGRDRIETPHLTSNHDVLALGKGITQGNTEVTSGPDNDIVLSFTDGGSITLVSENDGSGSGVETITFADGSSWDLDALRVHIATNMPTSPGVAISGGDGPDTLLGGPGDDTLQGGGGDDTYLYDLGGGHDRIEEGLFSGAHDTLVLGSSITQTNTSVSHGAGDDIVLTFSDGGSITLVAENGVYGSGVETIAFADGSTWNLDALHANIIAHEPVGPGALIAGGGDSDTLLGGPGDDTLQGGGGDDTYLYDLGGGHDRIEEGLFSGAHDTLVLGSSITQTNTSVSHGAGDDIVLTFSDGGSITLVAENGVYGSGVETIAFADGTSWNLNALHSVMIAREPIGPGAVINGGDGSDTLLGGPGDDTLQGGGGDDTYLYSFGGGHDVIQDGQFQGNHDTLVLGQGLTQATTTVTQINSSDIQLTFSDGGSIVLASELNPYESGIETVQFSDGTSWNLNDLQARLAGRDPNAPVLIGGAGQDTLHGTSADDTLQGGDGDDTYIYNPGDGNDTVTETAYHGFDTLKLGTGISADHVVVTRDGTSDDLTLSFSDQGGSIHIPGAMSGAYIGVERISFADGTSWSWDDLSAKVFAGQETSGNDLVIGFNAHADTLQGGLGDDTLQGGDGDDTYIYNPGDGNDTVTETAYHGFDTLKLGTGISADHVVLTRVASSDDIIVTFSNQSGSIDLQSEAGGAAKGVEAISFADGSVWDWNAIQSHTIVG